MKNILIKPVISEKSLKKVEVENQYTFVVNRTANKVEIAKEIQKKFNVSVLKVRITNVLGKRVLFGKKRIESKKSDYKKAIVSLKDGDKIAIFNLK